MIAHWYLIFVMYESIMKIPMATYKDCDEAKAILKENVFITPKSLACIHTGY